MRWIWSGVLMTGLLLVLWGAFEAGGQSGTAGETSGTPGTVRYYGEDGTPLPMPWPIPKDQQG